MEDHFDHVRALVAQDRFRVGALVRSARGDTLYEHDADRAFPSASVIKVPLVMTLYADAAEGRVDLRERLAAGDRVDGSGVLRDLKDVDTLSLRDLAALTIALSDNTATNRLIERVGADRVAERLAAWGCRATALRRKMYDTEAQKRGLENVASARDLVSLLTILVAGELVDRATADAVIALLERCDDDRKLRRFLAPDAKVPSKSGTLDASQNDVAIFRGPERVVIAAVFTSEVTDTLAAEHLLGLIGRGAALAAGMSVPALPFALPAAR